MLLIVPVQSMLARRIGRNRRDILQFTDERVKLLSEMLNGIKFVKLNALEVRCCCFRLCASHDSCWAGRSRCLRS